MRDAENMLILYVYTSFLVDLVFQVNQPMANVGCAASYASRVRSRTCTVHPNCVASRAARRAASRASVQQAAKSARQPAGQPALL